MGINISEANQFIKLHAHPQRVGGNDLSLLNDWISKYPYCQSLHFLAAQATRETQEAELYLAKAATFASNRSVLFQLVNHVETFETEAFVLDESLNTPVEITEVIEPRNDMGQAFGADLNYYKAEKNVAVAGEEVEEAVVSSDGDINEDLKELQTEDLTEDSENVEEFVAEENTEEPVGEVEEIAEQESVLEIENTEDTTVAEEVEEPVAEVEEVRVEEIFTQETENIEEIELEDAVDNVEEIKTEEIIQETADVEEVAFEENIVEPIHEYQEAPIKEASIDPSVEEILKDESAIPDEIVQETENVEEVNSEDIVEETETSDETQNVEPVEDDENVEKIEVENTNQESESTEETQTDEPNQVIEPENKTLVEESVNSKKDELILDSPVASDFFAFAKAEKPAEVVAQPKSEKQGEKPVAETKEGVSQYNDERLPYTFLWWLNKTRKEHASNNQPYAKVEQKQVVKRENTADRSLNRQIAENIFHLRGAEEIGVNESNNQTVPFDFRKKEFTIIEKFIKEEPQIKPPAANKIDSENKAKKSSEDANQVVSETLAKIYVEQMLYHKALDVYKKLSLKYPEKSTYFASQIKYLELKVN